MAVRRGRWLLPTLLALAVLATGCSTGSYRRDVFAEMHYQQSYRSQEPQRFYPPADSVPVTGREVEYDFVGASGLTNPVTATPDIVAKAAQLYAVNCAMCHGPQGRGDGPMAERYLKENVPPPVDFASERVRARNEGQLFWVLSNGIGNMPSFGPLLTAEERWTLVRYVLFAK